MKNLTIISILALSLLGCGPTLYIPNTPNTPLLAEKGDYQARASLNLTSNSPNMNLQGAYAVNDKLAVMGNLAHMSYTGTADSRDDDRHSLAELGIGRYWAFSTNACGVNTGRAEIFGGSGIGWATDNDNFGPQHRYQGLYNRWFIQPGIGYKGRIFEASLAARLSYIDFLSYKHEQNGTKVDENKDFGFSTIEPVLNLALGYRRGKVFWQFGYVEPLEGDDSDYYAVSSDILTNVHFNIGFTFNPWKENCPPKPSVALREQKLREENTQPVDSTQAATETLPSAPVIPLKQSNATICVRDAGSSDGDIVNISFNGAKLAENLELGKRAQCFEINAVKGEENLLQIQAVSEGKFLSNTIQVTVKEGRSERKFYIRTEAGKTEEIRFGL